MGIIIKQYKDDYETTSISWNKRFLFVAVLFWNHTFLLRAKRCWTARFFLTNLNGQWTWKGLKHLKSSLNKKHIATIRHRTCQPSIRSTKNSDNLTSVNENIRTRTLFKRRSFIESRVSNTQRLCRTGNSHATVEFPCYNSLPIFACAKWTTEKVQLVV